jgi:hypothetical protein
VPSCAKPEPPTACTSPGASRCRTTPPSYCLSSTTTGPSTSSSTYSRNAWTSLQC